MASTPKTIQTKAPTTRKSTTSTRARTTSTATKAQSTTSKPAAAPEPNPIVVAEATTIVSGPELKKSELIEAVVERSGIKKRYAKPSIEAALAVLGEALEEGRTLNLMPMGKAKVQKSKEIAGGQVLSVRVRQRQRVTEANETASLAEPAE
ncbi:HU family DNA-binding protein [Shimia sp.]|uniref:HU family DNA-binding protein n=1 Tax=Shimia sp. TaxID=1954381 RepID=UPI00329905AB